MHITHFLLPKIWHFRSSRGGLGGKCKTMFTQVFISSPGGSNQLGSKLCRVSLNKKEKTRHSSGLCKVSMKKNKNKIGILSTKPVLTRFHFCQKFHPESVKAFYETDPRTGLFHVGSFQINNK